MSDKSKNDTVNSIRTLRAIGKLIKDVKIGLTTPIDESTFIRSYGKIVFNTDSGLLSIGNVKITLRQKDRVYKIVSLLTETGGKEILYTDLIRSLDLPNSSGSKKLITSSIRDLRRRLHLSGKENSDKNVFIMTGSGIKLAYKL